MSDSPRSSVNGMFAVLKIAALHVRSQFKGVPCPQFLPVCLALPLPALPWHDMAWHCPLPCMSETHQSTLQSCGIFSLPSVQGMALQSACLG